MNYLLVVLVIGLLITVHELGHLLAALRSGLPVKRFSVGFGPKLFSFWRNGVEYCISLIPLGGYVLPEVEDEKQFFAIPARKRIVFALGGPMGNLVFGFILFAAANLLNQGFSVGAVLLMPVEQTLYLIKGIISTIPMIFTHTDQLAGVVRIVAQGGELVQSGLASLLIFTAFLSINFAIFNLLPIPVLDGGQILLTLLEKLNPGLVRIRIPLAIAGWLVMIGLMIYVTSLDIIKLSSGSMF